MCINSNEPDHIDSFWPAEKYVFCIDYTVFIVNFILLLHCGDLLELVLPCDTFKDHIMCEKNTL